MFTGLRAWAALAALMLGGLAGEAYAAACCNVPTTHQVRVPGVVVGRPGGCGSNCAPTPPPCDSCSPPPSCTDNCGGGRKRRRDFSGDFSFNAELSVSASAAASSVSRSFANSAAFGLAGANNGSAFFGGNGGSSFYVDYNTGFIPNLLVEEAAAASASSVTRTMVKIVAIQAMCIDDKQVPHPASQATPDKQIADGYEGELYRCLAGTRMQFTLAEFNDKVSFEGGRTTTCQKGDALYHAAGGKIECRPQRPARDCNERSLLRRYGAGIKIVKVMSTETQTVQASASASAQASAMGMAIDGGVGGIAH